MQWITGTIMGMGGMQACGFTLEKVQNEGLSITSYDISILKKKSFALLAYTIYCNCNTHVFIVVVTHIHTL